MDFEGQASGVLAEPLSELVWGEPIFGRRKLLLCSQRGPAER